MPKIDLVPVMRKAPGRCGICNTTPMENGEPKPAIDTNVDVDWGNNLYICDECVRVIGELMGWTPPEVYAKLMESYADLESRHEKLRSKFKELRGRLDAVIAGKKAERKHKVSKRKARSKS